MLPPWFIVRFPQRTGMLAYRFFVRLYSADITEFTFMAAWFLCLAYRSPMGNYLLIILYPMGIRQLLHEVELYFCRVCVVCEPKTAGYSHYMGIHNDAWDFEYMTTDNVCGFATYAA